MARTPSSDSAKTEAELIRDQVRVEKQLSNHDRVIRAQVGGSAGIGLRLDKFLTILFPRFTRSMIQRWLKHDWCTVDGLVASPKQVVRPFQLIVLHTPLPELAEENRFAPLELLYHQDGVVLLNKPPGQLPHQAGKILTGTLLNQLHDWCDENGYDTLDTRLVNRIDRDTSGIVLCSLNIDVHKKLSVSLQKHDFKKEYTAICIGVPDDVHGHWRDAIGPGSDATVAREICAASQGGQESHTEYFVSEVSANNDYALLRIILHTGRQHQIRVHAAHNGFPLVGDWVYGEPCAELDGQALHAASLEFPHPRDGATERVVAPLPDKLANLWMSLKNGGQLHALEYSQQQLSKLGLLNSKDASDSRWRKPSWLSDDEYRLLQESQNEDPS